MKKVLIISYCFPPRPVIGSQRPYGLAKYLHEFGWESVVVTPAYPGKTPEGIQVIRTDYKCMADSLKKSVGLSSEKKGGGSGLIVQSSVDSDPRWRRITKPLKDVILFPDENRGWYDFAVKAALGYLKNERVDAIVSSSLPVTCHLIAKRIKEKTGIPWVADFRDLWTQNHYYDKGAVIRFIERRFELRTLKRADALVTVSEPLRDTLEALHRGKKVYCVTNGYDEDEYGTEDGMVTDKFTITYTGSLHEGKRDPALLFEAMRQLIAEERIDRSRVEIRFYGREGALVTDMLKRYNMEGIVRFYGFVSKEEAVACQKESQLLLLLLWNNSGEEGVFTGKIFEYLGARRPIVAIGWSRGVVVDLLRRTGAGGVAGDLDSLKAMLAGYYREFKESGRVTYRGNDRIKDYTYRNISEEYALILDALSGKLGRHDTRNT